jgi:hypothetical protein
MNTDPIVVWHNPSNETRVTLSPSSTGYLVATETRLVSSWESTQVYWLSEEQLIALYGVLATLFPPGPGRADDVPLPLQQLSTASLLIEAIESGYWASALGGDIRGEASDRRLQLVAGEINRRLYQFLNPSPWICLHGEEGTRKFLNLSQIPIVISVEGECCHVYGVDGTQLLLDQDEEGAAIVSELSKAAKHIHPTQ